MRVIILKTIKISAIYWCKPSRESLYMCVCMCVMFLSVNSVLFMQLFCIAYRIGKYGDTERIVYCSPLNSIDFTANFLHFFSLHYLILLPNSLKRQMKVLMLLRCKTVNIMYFLLHSQQEIEQWNLNLLESVSSSKTIQKGWLCWRFWECECSSSLLELLIYNIHFTFGCGRIPCVWAIQTAGQRK